MFTGIIEHLGTVDSLNLHADGGRLTIHAPSVAPHLAVANSIAVNGCCLTVVALENERFSADLSAETIRKTSTGEWKAGLRVNLEQPMTAGKEFGGHFVLGHVDTIGRVVRLEAEGENWWYGVEVPQSFVSSIVPQGSIAIDGISLTVARWNGRVAEIAIIPFLYMFAGVIKLAYRKDRAANEHAVLVPGGIPQRGETGGEFQPRAARSSGLLTTRLHDSISRGSCSLPLQG